MAALMPNTGMIEQGEIEGNEVRVVKTKILKPKTIHSKSTLFVSTLPFEASAKDVEDFFSHVGPIKSCFVVKNKETGLNTGCGYVQYAMAEDAEKALTTLKKKKFQGKRTLKIVLAVRKSVVGERKISGIPLDFESREAKKEMELARIKKRVKVVPAGPGKFNTCKSKDSKKVNKSVTVMLANLPAVEKNVLYKKVRKFGTIVELVLADNTNELAQSTAKVVYTLPEEAVRAKKHLDEHIYKAVKISCRIVDTVTEASLAKKARLIVRNLAFQCLSTHLIKVFGVFGEIVDCNVPALPDGKARGFGFVQFKTVDEAQKAINGVNGQKILGRPVAVDWALGKTQFDRLNSEQEHEAEIKVTEGQDINDESSVTKDPNLKVVGQQNDFIIENESESESEDEDSLMDEQSIVSNSNSNESMDDTAIIYDSDQDGFTSDDQDVHHETEEEVEECTLFIRNLSFETTKDKLRSTWGQIRYALITQDKSTGLSRGSGFVSFLKVQSAKNCLEEYEKCAGIFASFQPPADETDTKDKFRKSILIPSLPQSISDEISIFTIDGRFLNATPSVSKQIANKITTASTLNRRSNDKRHLYLIREGIIFPGTEAASELTPVELEHRVQQFANRKRLLATNPNLFISRTRLSVRGLHSHLTDNQLRNAAKHAVHGFWEDVKNGDRDGMEDEVIEEEKNDGFANPSFNRKVIIKQAKIIKETDRIDSTTKKPKSKGYGFIEFASHADALACLRHMNNNIAAFAKAGLNGVSSKSSNNEVSVKIKQKKPIVEFAVENRLVLKKRNERNRGGNDKVDALKSKSDSGAKTKLRDLKRKRPVDTSSKNPIIDTLSGDDKIMIDSAGSDKLPVPKKKEFKTFKERREIRKAKSREPKKPQSAQASNGNVIGVPEVSSSNRKPTQVADESTRPSKREVKRVKKNADEDKFQSLVLSYKTKIQADTPAAVKNIRSKWYE